MTVEKINSATINSSHDAFVITGEEGIKVMNVQPLNLLRGLDTNEVGSLKLGTMLHRSNLVCFVGEGSKSKYADNTVMVYNNDKAKIVMDITVPGGRILNIHVSYNRLVVVQARRLYIFQFPSKCKVIRTEEIALNPTGMSALSTDDQCPQMLAYPGFKTGTVSIMNLNSLSETESAAPITINAHYTDIAQLAINSQGTLVATGSTKGTVIRVFETRTQNKLMELRRGTVQVTLHCIAFSSCSSWLAVSSDKGTIHIFGIRDHENRNTSNKVLRHVGYNGNTNIAKVSVKSQCLALGFTKPTPTAMQSLIAVCADGSFHRFSFNQDGHVQRECYEELLQLAGEQEFWQKIV